MPVRFHHHQLANGLTIVAEANDEAHTAAAGFFVKTGSRDEDPALMGVSHFLEHMMFKGTARRTAADVNREFDELGANYNAYTSQENTAYWAQVLPEFLPAAVDLIGDIMRPALGSEDFEMEKKVILEEIGMYEDRPQWRLQDTIIEMHFGDHPLGHRVLGTNDTVGSLGIEQMRGYFQRRYSPENITVSAAGRLEFDRFVEDVTKVAGDWQPAQASRRYDEPVSRDASRDIVDAKLNRHYLAVMCPAPTAQDDRRYAAGVLADVLGDVDGSRLYWALIDLGLADEADFSHFTQDRAGSYFACASCDPDRAGQVENILLETIDGCRNGIDVAEVERVKNKIATHATLQGESPLGRMRSVGTQWTYLGRYLSLDEELGRIMAVTVDDIGKLIADFPFQPRTTVRLGPKEVGN